MNNQEKFWSGNDGNEYNKRCTWSLEEVEKVHIERYGVTRKSMYESILNDLPKEASILEVGCNTGNQLLVLQAMGFKNIYAIDLNSNAVIKAKERTGLKHIYCAGANKIPFPAKKFDLVFTSGVLIHIAPNNVQQAMTEINRVSKQYILGLEYFAEFTEGITYRGKDGFLWKDNFSRKYLKLFPELKLVKENLYQYLTGEEVDQLFLLEKEIG